MEGYRRDLETGNRPVIIRDRFKGGAKNMGEAMSFEGGEPTRVLNRAVKGNSDICLEDLMSHLNDEEFAILRSQIMTSRWGGALRVTKLFETFL
jgi:hypothetical protein